MAFAEDSAAVSTTTPNNQFGSSADATSAPAAPTVSGQGAGIVGNGSNPGTGAGGTGSFTNIQAYLNANQGDQGSAKNLSDTIGGQFSKDQSNMQNQSQKTISDANDYVKKTNVSPDQANQWITGAQNSYSWDPQKPSADYNNYVTQAQQALSGQYQGPSSFSYSLDPNSQNYGTALGNDGAFKNMMTNIYSQKAGTPLTSGQADLQSQFDANNTNLAGARQAGLAQYSNLQQQRDQVNQDTTKALAGNQTDFANNQQNFKNYLGDQSTVYNDKIKADDAAARAGYNTEYNSPSVSGMNFDGSMGNLSPAQIQSYMNSGLYRDWASGDPHAVGNKNFYASLAPELNSFNTAEDAKYANADDNSKQGFNSIQDFLGNKNQQTQGFKVRG